MGPRGSRLRSRSPSRWGRRAEAGVGDRDAPGPGSAPPDAQRVRGLGLGEGRPPGARAWAGAKSGGSLPPPSPPREAAPPAVSAAMEVSGGGSGRRGSGNGRTTHTGLGLRPGVVSGNLSLHLRQGTCRPPGTEGLLCALGVADPQISLITGFPAPLEGDHSAIWVASREGPPAGEAASLTCAFMFIYDTVERNLFLLPFFFLIYPL